MLRIGVDARLLSLPLMGIGRYTAEMLRALKKHDSELYLYSPSRPKEADWSNAKSTLRVGNYNHRISRLIWSQSLLPYWAAKDKVDVFWSTTHSLPGLLPANIARVVTIHDLVWKHAPETMKRSSRVTEHFFMPKAIKQADIIIADSYSTANDLEAEFPNARGRVRVVHLGASNLPHPESKNTLKELGIYKPYFLFVGTLEPRKNLTRLIEAYALLPKMLRSQFQFVIVGGKGWGGVNIDGISAKFNVTKDLCITGFVTDSQLSTLYAHARFLAMPSLYEGFGLPLIESMSFGVPVLTSNISSMPEVAGNAGVLVNPLDTLSIHKELTRMLTDDALHSVISAHSKEVASRYSWDKAAASLLAACQEAVDFRKALKVVK